MVSFGKAGVVCDEIQNMLIIKLLIVKYAQVFVIYKDDIQCTADLRLAYMRLAVCILVCEHNQMDIFH